MSELISHFFPKLVELHNYTKTEKPDKKKYNWKTLNGRIAVLSAL